MKIIVLIALTFILSFAAFAQTAPQGTNAPNITVVKKKWGIKRATRNTRIVSRPEDLSRTSSMNDSISRQNDKIRDDARANAGLPPQPDRTATSTLPTLASLDNLPKSKPLVIIPSSLDKFDYEVVVRNNGAKPIQEMIVHYVFFDPNTKKELLRIKAVTPEILKPGRDAKVTVRSSSPPTTTIAADAAGKPLPDQYIEEVQIKLIKYSDGSVWKDSN